MATPPSVFLALALVSIASAANDPSKPIDTQRSSLTIHVGKAGLFSAAAHEHWVNAPIASGAVDDISAVPTVRFAVNAAKLTVMADKNVSSKDRAEVQSNMQNKVLESSKYPNIAFQSIVMRREANGAWKVDGNLTLHGATKRVVVDVKREKDAYVGTARIKQTDFDIQPIQIGGGVVKVKNELDIRFEVYVTSRPAEFGPH